MLSNHAIVESRMAARRRDAEAHRLVAVRRDVLAPRGRQWLLVTPAFRRGGVPAPCLAGCT